MVEPTRHPGSLPMRRCFVNMQGGGEVEKRGVMVGTTGESEKDLEPTGENGVCLMWKVGKQNLETSPLWD